MPARRKWRQGDQRCKAYFSYIGSYRSAWATPDPVSISPLVYEAVEYRS